MEWMTIIKEAIDYMEEHITEQITVEDVAGHVCVSPFYFHKGFGMLCGYSLMEYVRNRRLSLAGQELISSDITVTELAMKYGYDSPDSFSKAFARFHGFTPSMARRKGSMLKIFAPIHTFRRAKKPDYGKSFRTVTADNIIERWLSYGLQNYEERKFYSSWLIKKIHI